VRFLGVVGGRWNVIESDRMDEKDRLEVLEQEKERMIRRYLELQDQADELNGVIYRLCCDIEVLNLRIQKAREEVQKAECRAAVPQSFRPPSSNGTNSS